MSIVMKNGIPYDDSLTGSSSYLCSDRHMLSSDLEVATRIHSMNLTIRNAVQDPQNPSQRIDLNFNTYGDFHLIPSKRPVIVPPSVNTRYVEVPCSEIGDVDQTEALTGNVTYKNREGTLEFYYENSIRYDKHSKHSKEAYMAATNKISDSYLAYDIIENSKKVYGFKPWYEIYDALMNYVHGRRMNLTLMDDPMPKYYYYGRVWVSSFESGQDGPGTVQLTYKLEPYRYLAGDSSVKKI